jgi:N-acetylated-alpha-linked acidic dipeptidase
MKFLLSILGALSLSMAVVSAQAQTQDPVQTPSQAANSVFGFADFTNQAKIEKSFLSVPNADLAGAHLKALTAKPHLAATPEDHETAEYVAAKFREAGLDTEIVPYRVYMNQPKKVLVEAFSPDGKLLMSGPQREHVEGDAFQDDPRVVMPFNGSSASGDLTGEVIYANYGRLEDFDELAAKKIDLHGKIVLVRYGGNFRGIKVYIAEQRGAAAVLIYSDPFDDGYFKGDIYPHGPWRPETAVQRGSVQMLSKYSGDPQTPGVASTMDLPDSARIQGRGNEPGIPSIPLSYHDAAPILQALQGSPVPQSWQGALPFHYHYGPGGVRVHVVSDQDYQLRTIWDVIGKIKGTDSPEEWVIAGNHRDAWVYGAVDPNSGTAAMLESVHGIGELLKQGWKPKRTIVFSSWDAEEEGLIGSTEWVEQHGAELTHAVAYFNMDVGVAGSEFGASSVPSLQRFIRQITQSVPSPTGQTVYEAWKSIQKPTDSEHRGSNAPLNTEGEPHVGDLGSGSDFTPFLQHAGVPSTDIGSGGPYGVYHSAFDNYAWFVQNADPHFVYLQEMARVFGLEVLRMADADVLPYDYSTYTHAISGYIASAKKKAGELKLTLDFAAAESAATRLNAAAEKSLALQTKPQGNLKPLNLALRMVESDLLSDSGLPNRPWYKHTIYAPGEYTGYAAVVIPGVFEAVDSSDVTRATEQLTILTDSLNRAARRLESVESAQ